MGLFSRRRPDDAEPARDSSPGDPEPASREPEEVVGGPWDSADAPEASGSTVRVDLGSLRVPAVDGMQIRLESPGAGAEAGAVVLVLGGSSLELRAFAAPRSTGIWEELREDITAELTRTRASHKVVSGPHGPEILAQVPVRGRDGHDSTVAVRFIGVDGPRWFLRGVLQGRAATDEAASRSLREVFADVVVVRDGAARPPREILPLHAPGAGAAPEAEDLPGLDPLSPGPTIAEVR
ncbi:DUF3710 domain-containing protein [Actinomyces howellii]|uniref:Protein of uncharacterized function (DUF3710) n=1 Tax=Actinomyces howellii TaxID=52771 RepID=A0A3S4SLR7_9ACTO|nr:DUF3710 domain-containing protein [Actinomyces howellii]VEG26419.1 Protein of uncharacterised function (DUF3710) [Actinomyces howellii]